VVYEVCSGLAAVKLSSVTKLYRYLKRVLLPTLVNQHVIEQTHVKPTVKADEKAQTLATMSKSQRQSSAVKTALHGYFGWQAKQQQPKSKIKLPGALFGSAVGVGESWAHLNKRRQRTREEVVRKEVEWVKEVEAARRHAMRN
jgi:hypothetical protein